MGAAAAAGGGVVSAPSLDWRREPPTAANVGECWALCGPEATPFLALGFVSGDDEVGLTLDCEEATYTVADFDKDTRWARVPLPAD